MGALQMMLDRGELKDWFGSEEIWIECALAALGFYSFIVHSLTVEHPFLHPAIFKDRNLTASLVVGFVVGVVFLASVALLPPLLQNLMDYPVTTTGIVIGPRGIGMMLTMVLVGRWIRHHDPRWPMLVGFLLVAYSLWDMATHFSLQMDSWTVVSTGFTQGLGLGLIFPPLSTIAFATLPPSLRTEAAGIFNLARNAGSSVGLSIVTSIFAMNLQVAHASLAAHVTPYNAMLRAPHVPALWNMQSHVGMAALNAEVTRQAAMISYIDDFKLMMIVTLAAIPLVALMRNTHFFWDPSETQTADPQ